MSEKVIFAAEEKLGLVNEGSISYLNSQYLARYNKNRFEIKNRNSWKTEGQGAAFMGVSNEMSHFDPSYTRAKVNGITALKEADRILYTITVNDMSGIFSKNPFDDSDSEMHIIHKSNVEFLNIDYNSCNEKLVVSVRENSFEKHLAILDVNKGHYDFITEGESMDENPSWSATNNQVIYYDSCGIGLDTATSQVANGPRSICRLDLTAGTADEVISEEKYDYIKPKEDKLGNLYFIKKPLKQKSRKYINFLDILLFPFRLLKALFGWLNFFTMRYSGENLITRGQNPAKAKEKTPEEIFIEGNLVNAEKALKENKNSGDKYPGFAPGSWELVKLGPDGQIVRVKKGVIDFDIDSKGRIYYSNGIYLVRISEDLSEEVIGKVQLATKVKIL